MKKIPTLFVRDLQTHKVIDEISPGCEWVVEGLGRATRKFDGQCCVVRGGILFKRREVKKGKPEPYGFQEVDNDANTGKRMGWVEVGNGSDDKYFMEAFQSSEDSDGRPFIDEQTYELLGPKVQGNPEKYEIHVMMKHGRWEIKPCPGRDYVTIANYFVNRDVEGIVWHHPDGRMAKIKGKDFGIKRR